MVQLAWYYLVLFVREFFWCSVEEERKERGELRKSDYLIVKSKRLKVRFGCPTGSHFGRAVSQSNIFFVKISFFWNKLRNIFHLIKIFPRLSGRPEIRICQEKSIDGAPKWR
jgi:hypothetical protein